MSLTPETLFDTIIDLSNAGGDVQYLGGITYYSEYDTSVNNTSLIVTGKVIHIEGSDLSSLDPSNNSSMQTGLKFPIFTFSNGVELGVSVWTKYDGWQLVCVSGYLKYNNTYHWPGESYYLRTAGGAYLSTESSYTALNLAKQYGVKLWFNTDYAYGNGQAIKDQTRANYVQLCCVIPWTSTGGPAGHQSWAHISDSETLFSQRQDDPDPSTWISNPQYLWFGYDTFPKQGIETVWSCDDLNNFDSLLNAISPLPHSPWTTRDPNNPTQESDPSGPGGGGGNMDKNSDPIPFPELPVGGAIDSGAIKAFLLPNTTIKAMFQKLWDASIFDIATFQKLVESPIDCIISLHCLPVTPATSGIDPIILGNFDTELLGNVISNQYLTIDCGSLSIKEYWGSALDYAPYTKVELYMPFVGIKQLTIDDVMDNTIHIKYNIDVLTGDCVCNVMCGQSVLYKFAGNMKMDMPVTGRTNTALFAGLQGAASAFAGGMMGGAVGGPVGAAIGVGAVLSSAATVATSKIVTSRSGSLAGSVSLLEDFRPYFIFHRPVQSLASNFKSYKGYPSNITKQLSSVKGYTEIEYINLQNIPDATSEEMDEIKTLLKNGVII